MRLGIASCLRLILRLRVRGRPIGWLCHGQSKEKTEPWPSWLVTLTVPLWAAMWLWRSANPCGAADQVALILAAIKLVENHGLLEVFDAGTAVGDAGSDGVARLFGRDGDGLVLWRIEIGVVDELDNGFPDAFEIGGYWREIVVDFKYDFAACERSFGMAERCFDDVGNLGGLKIEFDFAGFELGHFAGFFDEMVQAIALFVDDREKFFALGRIGILGSEEAADGGFHGGERRAEVVGDGIEQSGFEALALALGFGLAELLDGAGALDGDGDERADGFDGLAEKRAGMPRLPMGRTPRRIGRK